jgi:hypothetical protein
LTLIAAAGVVLLIWAIGKAMLPDRDEIARSRWEDASLAYLVGVSAVVLLGNLLLAVNLSMTVVAVAFACIGLIALRRCHNKRGGAVANTGLPSWQWALLLVLGLASIAATLAYPINEFDPMLHFAYKGKVLYHAGTPFDPSLTGMLNSDDKLATYGRVVTHPNYPLGIPILEALVAKFSTTWNDRWIQLPLAFWAACLPGAVFFGLRSVSKKAARAGALIAACTPILYARNIMEMGWGSLDQAGLTSELSLGAGADLPVAALVTAACALLLVGMRQSHLRLQLLGGLCLAGAAMMKNEGQAILGVVFLALLTGGLIPPLSRRAPTSKATSAAMILSILAILPWLSIRSHLPAIDENYADHFTPSKIAHFLTGGAEIVEKSPKAIIGKDDEALANPPARMDHLPGYFWEEFTDWRSWGLIWLLLLAALPWTLRELKDPTRRWLALIALGGVALYFLILLVTPWYLPLLREKGIPERLLLHLLGPISMLIGWRLGGQDEKAEELAGSE